MAMKPLFQGMLPDYGPAIPDKKQDLTPRLLPDNYLAQSQQEQILQQMRTTANAMTALQVSTQRDM